MLSKPWWSEQDPNTGLGLRRVLRCKPDAATHLAPQYDQLMSERSVFCLKSIAEIAAAESINESSVGRVLRLTLLAP